LSLFSSNWNRRIQNSPSLLSPLVKSSSSSPNACGLLLSPSSPAAPFSSPPPILTSNASCLTEKALLLAGETTDAPPRCILEEEEEDDDDEEAIGIPSATGSAEEELQHEKIDPQNELELLSQPLLPPPPPPPLRSPELVSGATVLRSEGLDAFICAWLGEASFCFPDLSDWCSRDANAAGTAEEEPSSLLPPGVRWTSRIVKCGPASPLPPAELFGLKPPTLPDPREDDGVDVDDAAETTTAPPDDRLEDETTAPPPLAFKAGEFKPASLRRAVDGEDIEDEEDGISEKPS